MIPQGKPLLLILGQMLSFLLTTRGNHRLYRLCEILAIRLCFRVRDVILMRKEGTPGDRGALFHRCSVFSLALTSQTHGLYEHKQLAMLPHILEYHYTYADKTWSALELKFYPEIMRDSLLQLQAAKPRRPPGGDWKAVQVQVTA